MRPSLAVLSKDAVGVAQVRIGRRRSRKDRRTVEGYFELVVGIMLEREDGLGARRIELKRQAVGGVSGNRGIADPAAIAENRETKPLTERPRVR